MQAKRQCFLYCVGTMLLLAMTAFNASAQDGPSLPKAHSLHASQFEAPISFEPNQGQAQEQVRFTARGPGYTMSLTQQGLVLSFAQAESRAGSEVFRSVAVKFVGANILPKLAAEDELTTKSSYFMGADPVKWRTGIPNYARVTIENIYPGVDVRYRGTHGRLLCSFVVAPGAKPERIRMAISGAHDPRLDPEGNLILRSGSTELRLSQPTTYQNTGASKHLASARYLVRRGRIAFALTDYDSTKALTMDAVLEYEGYLTTEDGAAPRSRFRTP